MDLKEPVLTLLSSLAVAGGLMALKAWTKPISAQPNSQEKQPNRSAGGRASGPGSATATTTTTTTGTGTATYAGAVYDATASVAITVTGGDATAYVCDGPQAEVLLRGTATGGQLTLVGPGSSLIGTVAGGVAAGTVTVSGQRWSFGVKAVTAPSDS